MLELKKEREARKRAEARMNKALREQLAVPRWCPVRGRLGLLACYTSCLVMVVPHSYSCGVRVTPEVFACCLSSHSYLHLMPFYCTTPPRPCILCISVPMDTTTLA